jgi:hypothetical protein
MGDTIGVGLIGSQFISTIHAEALRSVADGPDLAQDGCVEHQRTSSWSVTEKRPGRNRGVEDQDRGGARYPLNSNLPRSVFRNRASFPFAPISRRIAA